MSTITFGTMGTAVALTMADAAAHAATVESVFRDFDERYSLYRPNSELARVASGQLALASTSEELRSVYAAALDWRARTAGAFSPHRPDGVLDLSGIVKALAMQQAGDILDLTDASWLINAGGDVLGRGSGSSGGSSDDDSSGEPGVVYRGDGDELSRALAGGAQPGDPGGKNLPTGGPGVGVGIVDPNDRQALLTVVTLTGERRAVATSGISERGEHVWRAGPAIFSQVSVVANDIVTADVLATAILSGGRHTLDFASETWPIDVLAVGRNGALLATPGIRAAMST